MTAGIQSMKSPRVLRPKPNKVLRNLAPKGQCSHATGLHAGSSPDLWHPHLRGERKGFQVSGWVSTLSILTALHDRVYEVMPATWVCWLDHAFSLSLLQNLTIPQNEGPHLDRRLSQRFESLGTNTLQHTQLRALTHDTSKNIR